MSASEHKQPPHPLTHSAMLLVLLCLRAATTRNEQPSGHWVPFRIRELKDRQGHYQQRVCQVDSGSPVTLGRDLVATTAGTQKTQLPA